MSRTKVKPGQHTHQLVANLDYLARNTNYSRERIASVLSVNDQQVKRILSGNSGLSYEQARALANDLGMPLDILGGPIRELNLWRYANEETIDLRDEISTRDKAKSRSGCFTSTARTWAIRTGLIDLLTDTIYLDGQANA